MVGKMRTFEEHGKHVVEEFHSFGGIETRKYNVSYNLINNILG